MSKGGKFAQPRETLAERKEKERVEAERLKKIEDDRAAEIAAEEEAAREAAEIAAEKARLQAIADAEAAALKAREDEIAAKKAERAKAMADKKLGKDAAKKEARLAAAAAAAAAAEAGEDVDPGGDKEESEQNSGEDIDNSGKENKKTLEKEREVATVAAAETTADADVPEMRPETPSGFGGMFRKLTSRGGSRGADAESPDGKTKRPTSAFGGFFGSKTPRPKEPKFGTRGKGGAAREYSEEDKNRAALSLQLWGRARQAIKKVKRKRKRAKQTQRLAGQMIWWAAVTIQKIARAKQGRKRHRDCIVSFAVEGETRIYNAAVTIQSKVRCIAAMELVEAKRAVLAEEMKQLQWAQYQKEAEEKKVLEEKKAQPDYDQVRQTEAIDEKLQKLAEMEKSMLEKERRMEAAAKEAELRSKEMQHALKLMQDRAAAEEAERASRKALMMDAMGSMGSMMSTNQSAMATQPTAKPALESSRHDGPPTGRSARGGAGIPASCRRVIHDSREWCELWDDDEEAYYWYCELTQEAQWDRPDVADDLDHGYASAGGGYQSEGGRTDYTSDHSYGYNSGTDFSQGGGGEEWTEYWDESAQAKYWYNNNSGEASWVQPSGSGGSMSGTSNGGSSQSSGGNGPPASARKNPQDWVSYIDETSGQEYWYNAKTGETSWA
jgi:hypothetical protein